MPLDLALFERADLLTLARTATPSPKFKLLPAREPLPGEQYRFHFDMKKCIGCKCCVVACNEQNGNPADLNWRRVGELEGGVFPNVQRLHLSMGCNHCAEPACMNGCPVKAYSKDSATGIVDHDPDMCIGCQYCTWNCSYGVPQFNEARGVVGKCDMCHGRLNQGHAPACVNACPEEAIEIEIVNIADWRASHASANAPGMPSADDSLSTTRITMPANVPADLARVDANRVAPQHAHPSLVLLLVLTQMSLGAFACLWIADLAGVALPNWSAIVPFLATAIAMAAAPAHLGRPMHAHRAWKGWKTSWLSREVIGLGAFAGAAFAYGAAMFLDLPFRSLLGAGAVIAGTAGVLSSARIYMVKARPAWDSVHTLVEFFLTALVLGPRLVLATRTADANWLLALAAVATLAQIANVVARSRRFQSSSIFELNASANLASNEMGTLSKVRLALLACALLSLPVPAASLVLALAAESAGRWLFFTTVVPKSMASTYLTPGGRAA